MESYQSRINQLESLLLRNLSPEKRKPTRRILRENPLSESVRAKPLQSPPLDDESSKDDETDSNMIDLTNAPERSPSPSGFATTSSAIDILHSIIQETSSSFDLPTMKKMKVRKLDDDDGEENEDYLVRPLVSKTKPFERSFNKYGGHTIPMRRRISQTSFKSKPKLNRSKSSSTKNNLKITTFFDLN